MCHPGCDLRPNFLHAAPKSHRPAEAKRVASICQIDYHTVLLDPHSVMRLDEARQLGLLVIACDERDNLHVTSCHMVTHQMP